MLSHSLSFWFRALVAHEPDLALEREVQKGCRSSGRKCVVTSPCWGCEVNVVHVHIFQEGTEMRSGRITVCLSVCSVPGKPGQDPCQPLSHPVAKASCSWCQQPQHCPPASAELWMGTAWPRAAWARGIGAVPGVAARLRWPPWLPRLPGSAICFSLEECEISFNLAEKNMFSEIY